MIFEFLINALQAGNQLIRTNYSQLCGANITDWGRGELQRESRSRHVNQIRSHRGLKRGMQDSQKKKQGKMDDNRGILDKQVFIQITHATKSLSHLLTNKYVETNEFLMQLDKIKKQT